MQACADDPATLRTRARALSLEHPRRCRGLGRPAGARPLTPAGATSTVAMERFAGQTLALGAPVAGVLVLGWLSLWRS